MNAVVSGGAVTGFTVKNAGSGYTSFSFLSIEVPPPNIVFQTYWRNAPDVSPADDIPDSAVSLPVIKGLYSILLGDTSQAKMAALPASALDHPDVRLRVWFDDKVNGFQQLSPDRRIAAVAYALLSQEAQTVADGAITTAKIASGAVGSTQLASGAITTAKIASGAVGGSQIASGAVGSTQLASGAVGSVQLAAGAVTTASIAAGAVTTASIAPGAITSTQLAKPPRSGTIASSSLDLGFNQASFTVPFSPAFGSAPIVTLGLRSGSRGAWQPSVWTSAVGTTSFTGQFTVPAEPLTLDSAEDVGFSPSMAVVNGNPAISYRDSTNGDLKFVTTNLPASFSIDWIAIEP